MEFKINIVISCGLLDVNNKIEIDRFKRFRLQLLNIQNLPNKPNNINWIFCEFGTESKLKNTIKSYLPNCEYLFYSSSEKFNQIACWNYVLETYNDYDFVIFTHSDILFSNNFYEILQKRIIDKNKNYYSFRLNAFIHNSKFQLNELKKYEIECSDEGMRYISQINNIEYTNKFTVCSYKNVVVGPAGMHTYESNFFVKENNQISESFICISKDNISKLNLNIDASYHNDVVIRDLSIQKQIPFEWIHDEICLVHMLGEDLNKSKESDFKATLKIIQAYPELAHFGVFRFHPDYISYLKNIDLKFLYNNYIEKDLYRDKTYEEQLKQLL